MKGDPKGKGDRTREDRREGPPGKWNSEYWDNTNWCTEKEEWEVTDNCHWNKEGEIERNAEGDWGNVPASSDWNEHGGWGKNRPGTSENSQRQQKSWKEDEGGNDWWGRERDW